MGKYIDHGLIQHSDKIGWPWMPCRFRDLYLHQCPNIVIPPSVQIDEVISITIGKVWFEILMDDDRHYCLVRGCFFPDELAQHVSGRPLSALVTVPHLVGHPLMNKTIRSATPFDPLGGELGIEVELVMESARQN